ncbi:hypothetical protein LY474_06265 [Myxococcus stipitatus]|uniref:hypothetical protein n=1 Tax=Myxococcus stipitatus TaxID=83455 RepID=UPI001F1D69B8|nr:hypothetical protein [Myxococcus stipitatus]MCE9667415.1 hypothetical protein [Myxococcus stipitatus]
MHLRTLVLATATLGLATCAHRPPAPPAAAPRAIRLLMDTPAQETLTFDRVREDVEVDTTEGERTPRVVTFGETPLLRLEGQRARLYGDAKATLGIGVDNFILLEVLDGKGQVKRRGVVGFTDNVHMGLELVDNVGRSAFTFEPGEVDITELLPESEPFQLRATVLDSWGVGRVSDVYVVFSAPQRAPVDELRGE